MFSGEYEHTVDDKGRVLLPAECADELGTVAVICRGMDGQINLFPKGTWERNLERLGRQNWARKTVRNVSRLAFSGVECEVDRQGRVLIPTWLRQHACLDTNVVILGMNDHLEIWNLERWQSVTSRLQTEEEEIAEQLAELGLRL